MAKVKAIFEDMQNTPEYQAGWEAYQQRKANPAATVEQLRLWHKGWEAARQEDLAP